MKLTRGGITVDKEYRMTTVDLNNIGYKDEPFVLAADVSVLGKKLIVVFSSPTEKRMN